VVVVTARRFCQLAAWALLAGILLAMLIDEAIPQYVYFLR
jgi:hypothetical protein